MRLAWQGGGSPSYPPFCYATDASPTPNKFCSIKTARTFNGHITRNALCQAKAGQSHQHAFCQNVKNIACAAHSALPPKVSSSQCCILSPRRITAASILTLTKFTLDGKNCQIANRLSPIVEIRSYRHSANTILSI